MNRELLGGLKGKAVKLRQHRAGWHGEDVVGGAAGGQTSSGAAPLALTPGTCLQGTCREAAGEWVLLPIKWPFASRGTSVIGAQIWRHF